MPDWSARYGFVGTGSITRAMVEGLSTADRPAADRRVPARRGDERCVGGAVRERAGRRRQPGRRRCRAVRRARAPPGATRRPCWPASSSPPGTSSSAWSRRYAVADLLAAAAPATRVARAIPLPSVAARQGLVPVVPRRAGRAGAVRTAGRGRRPRRRDRLRRVQRGLGLRRHPARPAGDGRGLAGRARRARARTPGAYVGVLLARAERRPGRGARPRARALADDHATPGGLNQQVREHVRGHGRPRGRRHGPRRRRRARRPGPGRLSQPARTGSDGARRQPDQVDPSVPEHLVSEHPCRT